MTSALVRFLAGVEKAGYDVIRIASPRGHDVLIGELPMSEEEIIDRCTTDASLLPAGKKHEYVVHVSVRDGSKTERHSLRIEGGDRADKTDHVVDPERVTNASAAIGHLCRTLVDVVKQHTALAKMFADRDAQDMKEFGRMRRAMLKNGEHETMRIILEKEAQQSKESGEMMRGIFQEAKDLFKLTMGKSPAAAKTILVEARESLTDAQHARGVELFGAIAWGRILSGATPEVVAAVMMTLPAEAFRTFHGELSERQQILWVSALGDAIQKASAAKQHANGAPAAEAS